MEKQKLLKINQWKLNINQIKYKDKSYEIKYNKYTEYYDFTNSEEDVDDFL